MPLSKIQSDVLRLLASHRNPESYVAGSTPLNRDTTRFSGDIDVFHDREDRVALAALEDTETLESHGYRITWLRRYSTIHSAQIDHAGLTTRLEWVVDSDFRFFPAIVDDLFGYVLHPVDLAMNKALAAGGRRELRDLVDLVAIHTTILPLGAVIWAAVEKAPGFTPEGLIAEIRRNSNYPAGEWRELVATEPLDPVAVMTRLRAALEEAEAFVLKMPTDKIGLLFLQDGEVVQPDPSRLGDYQAHAGRRRGHWPESSEIFSAMIEHYRAK